MKSVDLNEYFIFLKIVTELLQNNKYVLQSDLLPK